MAIPEDLAQLTKAHLELLVSNQTEEGPRFDIKREPPERSNSGRHSLCADLSAFANSSGGDLVFGVDEDGEGRTKELTPYACNPDEEERRLLDIILNGVEPRLPGVKIKSVEIESGKFVFVVRVPASWAGPHRVRTNQHFYLREGKRSRQLDMPEIKSLYERTGLLAQKLQTFRFDRISKILDDNLPYPLVRSGPAVVLHLIPVNAFAGGPGVDVIPFSRGEMQVPVLGAFGNDWRTNVDGIASAAAPQARSNLDAKELQRHPAYSQLFRDGSYESVLVYGHKLEGSEQCIIGGAHMEGEILKAIGAYRGIMHRLGREAEIVCMVTVLRAKAGQFGVDPMRISYWSNPVFDRDEVVLPDIVIEPSASLPSTLRPVFDVLWQSCGFERSFSYDADGKRLLSR